ncbi:MAG: hypothetical protein ACI4LM_06590 [Anaerovoracaceae bacterium]
MKEIMLEPEAPFYNNVDVHVMDFPNGYDKGNLSEKRQRCKLTVDYGAYDMNEAYSAVTAREDGSGESMEDRMLDFYREKIYDMVKVLISQDWECVGGMDDVLDIVKPHIEKYLESKKTDE